LSAWIPAVLHDTELRGVIAWLLDCVITGLHGVGDGVCARSGVACQMQSSTVISAILFAYRAFMGSALFRFQPRFSNIYFKRSLKGLRGRLSLHGL